MGNNFDLLLFTIQFKTVIMAKYFVVHIAIEQKSERLCNFNIVENDC